MLAFFSFCLYGQDGLNVPDRETLLQKGSSARGAENFQKALEWWHLGQILYPEEVRFPAALADMFYEKKLYRLSAAEYEKARRLRPTEYEYAYRLAESYGLLNLDNDALKVLEETRLLFPDDWDLIQAQAWLYFKLEEYSKGIDLILEATKRMGENPNAEMTLGTLYSSLYDFEKSRFHYQKSIDLGLTQRSRVFVSIAYYNRSILENTFYEPGQALESIQRSLEYAQRASGYIALGEMQEMRGDYALARVTYEEAASRDDTPLSKMNLAMLYLQTGNPEAALEYIRSAEMHPDPSWIYNFGLRESAWQKDLHRAYTDAYEQLTALADYEDRFWPWEWVSWLIKKIGYAWQGFHHRETWRSLTWESATESSSKGNTPLVLWKNFLSYEDYPWPAEKYLELSRKWEESVIPKSPPFYTFQTALIKEDPASVRRALENLDTVWDSDMIEEGLLFLLRKAPSSGSFLSEDTRLALFKRNSGLLAINNLPLPFNIEWEGTKPDWLGRFNVWRWSAGWGDPEKRGNTLKLKVGPDSLTWSLVGEGLPQRNGIIQGDPASTKVWIDLLRSTHRVIPFSPSSEQQE